MDFKDLSPEQIEKVKACKTAEDLIELAKAEGIELSEKDLAAVSGGTWDDHVDLKDCLMFSVPRIGA